MRYLGVPITASKLSKMECQILVDKIMGKNQTVVYQEYLFLQVEHS